MENNFDLVVRTRAIIIHEGRLLGVKHPHDLSFCALPGGKLEWKEDIKESLRRELVEELGVAPEIGRLWYINNYVDRDGRQSIEFIFEIKNSGDFVDIGGRVRTHAHEIAEICWLESGDGARLLPAPIWEDFQKGEMLRDEVKFIFPK